MSLKKRIIVVLFYKNGRIVQSYNFLNYKVIGNSTYMIKRINEWDVDELIYLNISKNQDVDVIRKDIPQASHLSFEDSISLISEASYAPLAIGGGITAIDQVSKYLRRGADKVVINSALFDNPKLIESIIATFGAQVILASIDYRKEDGYRVYKNGGRVRTKWTVADWMTRLSDLGVGEVLLNSIDRDGTKMGFDIEIVDEIPLEFNTPSILLGGAGKREHFKEVLSNERVHSVAAGNFFLHEDQSYYNLKQYLLEANLNVRSSALYIQKLKNSALL
jgi:cyclase